MFISEEEDVLNILSLALEFRISREYESDESSYLSFEVLWKLTVEVHVVHRFQLEVRVLRNRFPILREKRM
jgi:hypothetical protein